MIREDTRKDRRYKLTDMFIVHQERVYQVSNISSGGFSFSCNNGQELPEKLTVDIFNDKGVHIWDLPVLTVWKKKNSNSQKSSIHSVEVGTRFQDGLSHEHQSTLNELVEFLGNKNPL